MTTENPTNLPASVRARLKNKADEIGLDFNQVLQYYAMERFLFRLSKTKWADCRAWLEELLALLAERPAGLTWGCATRVDLVTEELLQRMAAAGCNGIQFGIESGAQEVLDSVKGIKKDDALDAVRWTVAAGMSATCSFMIPFPEDIEETLAETLAFMRVLKDAGGTLLMSYTTPYPGTVFAEKADELGLTILTDDWAQFDAKHVVMETRHLSAARIEHAAAEMARELGMSRSA